MEEQPFSPEALYEKAKDYTNTTLELAKLKALDKASDLVSTTVPRVAVIILLLLFAFCANMALSFWLGALTGQTYYGFLIVAGFYLLLALFIHYVLHKSIKRRIANAFIKKILE